MWGLGQDLDLSPGPWVEMGMNSVTRLAGDLNPLDVTGTIVIEGHTFATGSGCSTKTTCLDHSQDVFGR